MFFRCLIFGGFCGFLWLALGSGLKEEEKPDSSVGGGDCHAEDHKSAVGGNCSKEHWEIFSHGSKRLQMLWIENIVSFTGRPTGKLTYRIITWVFTRVKRHIALISFHPGRIFSK